MQIAGLTHMMLVYWLTIFRIVVLCGLRSLCIRMMRELWLIYVGLQVSLLLLVKWRGIVGAIEN